MHLQNTDLFHVCQTQENKPAIFWHVMDMLIYLGLCQQQQHNNNIFISYIKYTNITPPANSKANQGRWCVDSLRFITIVEVKKYHIYNKKGHSSKTRKKKRERKKEKKKRN